MFGLPRLLALFAFGLAATALLAAVPPRKPNVVFIVADDMRPDAPSCFGNTLIRTPNIDRLAARGAVFPRATCGYPICNVSRSEMFAGRVLLGPDVERGPGGGLKFDPKWVLWPEQMKRSGWHTVYTGKWHVGGSPRLDGFMETAGLFSSGGGPAGVKATLAKTPTGRAVTGYTGWTFKDANNKPLPELGVGLTPETDQIMTARAIEAIKRVSDRPFFLQVNFTSPHDPLHWPRGKENSIDYRNVTLPGNFRNAPGFDTGNINGRDEVVVPAPRTEDEVRKERAIYFSAVENVDAQVGRIVRAIEEAGQLEQTIIIFTSDHGLALGSHGLMGKQNQFEHTINVPLVLAGPGIPAGKRFAAQCYLRDLYPTICELTATPIPPSVQSRSLMPVLRGEKTEIHDAICGYFTDTQRMIRNTAGWKLIWYPKTGKVQLFQVNDDPEELRDRSGEPEQQARRQQMMARLAEWQRQEGDPLLASAH